MTDAGVVAIESVVGVYALVVDTDDLRRHVVGRILQYCGAHVRGAPTASRALAMVRQVRPDVLIADVQDDLVGVRLIRELRALKPDHGGVVPAIALGPHALEGAARDHGFDGYLPWPFAPWQLCVLVASLTAG